MVGKVDYTLVNVHIIVVIIGDSENARDRTCRTVSHGMNEGDRPLFDGTLHFFVNVLAQRGKDFFKAGGVRH